MLTVPKSVKLSYVGVKYPSLSIDSSNDTVLNRMTQKSLNFQSTIYKNGEESNDEQRIFPRKSI